MASSSSQASVPITVALPLSLVARIETFRRGRDLKNASEVVRFAIDRCNFERYRPSQDPYRQISVRLTTEQRAELKRFSKKKRASIGELMRLALEGLPETGAKKKR